MPPDPPQEGDFLPNQQGTYGTSEAFAGTNSGRTTSTAGGVIKTLYEWVPSGPGDLPPKSVIVTEFCRVSSSATSTKNDRGPEATQPPAPSANNGLPLPVGQSPAPATSGYYGNTWSVSRVSEGSYTHVMVGAQQLEIECTVSGSATATAPQYGSAGSQVIVAYEVVSVTPVEINLGGGIGTRGDQRYLMGQSASATITNGGLTPLSYSWTVSGGEPFESYAASDSTAVFTPLSSPLNGSSVQFYWKRPESVATITCTVVLAKPGGGTLSANAEAKCSVEKPSNSLSAYIGSVQGVPSANPSAMQLLGGTYFDANGLPYSGGIVWVGAVTTPPEWGPLSGWNFTQTVFPHRILKNGPITYPFSFNGAGPILDTNFGYYPFYPNLFTADGTKYAERDSPSQGFGGLTYVEVLDSFRLYTLYEPSGGALVPLKHLKWFWEGKASSNSSGAWQLYATAAEWSFLSDFPPHPTWTQNVKDGNFNP